MTNDLSNPPEHEAAEQEIRSPGATPRRKAISKHGAINIITDLPEQFPVLPAEIALIAAWWPALAEIISANDNDGT